MRLWDKVLLASKDSFNSWWFDREVDTAIEKEQELRKKYDKQVLAIIPLNLDGHLLDRNKSGEFEWKHRHAAELRKRAAANFTGWKSDNTKFDEQFELVVKALRSDDAVREEPPDPKL